MDFSCQKKWKRWTNIPDDVGASWSRNRIFVPVEATCQKVCPVTFKFMHANVQSMWVHSCYILWHLIHYGADLFLIRNTGSVAICVRWRPRIHVSACRVSSESSMSVLKLCFKLTTTHETKEKFYFEPQYMHALRDGLRVPTFPCVNCRDKISSTSSSHITQTHFTSFRAYVCGAVMLRVACARVSSHSIATPHTFNTTARVNIVSACVCALLLCFTIKHKFQSCKNI